VHDVLFTLSTQSGEMLAGTQGGMRDSVRIGGLAVGTAAFLAGMTLSGGVPAQPAPMPLLTDTAQYCAQLSVEVEAERKALISPAPPEVEQLAQEGRRLCALGEIRGGIVRLRRAIVLLHEVSQRS
jgi:hypothetical protein